MNSKCDYIELKDEREMKEKERRGRAQSE